MEFFTSTEFYCLAIVVAVALIGLLMSDKPQKPAETYITTLYTSIDAEPYADNAVCLNVMPDGALLISRSGIAATPDTGINLVVDVVGDKVRIVEKRATAAAASTLPTMLRGTAQLTCLRRGRYTVRYESEVTGMWAILALSMVEGYSRSAELRL